MKHRLCIYPIIALLFTCTIPAAQAQTVAEGESAIVYAMPKIVFGFEIEYEKQTQEIGIFYQYSERYLGTKDVVTENKTVYTIKNIRLLTKTVADESRKYKITPDKNLLNCYVTLNEKGILCAINDHAPANTSKQKKEEAAKSPTPVGSSLMPLGEEQMFANSIAKMAEGTAKQIYRIRESRINLLSGDVDQLPADGLSFRTVLDEMARTEKELCELFIGKTTTETLREVIEITPANDVNQSILARFSTHNGLVPKNDLGGTPIFLSIKANKQEYLPLTEKGKQQTAALFYNLPGSARVTVSQGQTVYVDKEVTVPQFGISVPLPVELFTKSDVKIQFNPKTGALLKIEK